VPWTRPGSGFTLLFEAVVLALAPHAPLRAIAERLREHDTRLWRVVTHYTDLGRQREDMSQVKRIGIDETASRRGQRYVSVFVDLDRSKALFATPGREAATVTAFVDDLKAHGGAAANIREVACDMGAGFLKGVSENLAEAGLTLDKFHVTKLVVDAVDQIRREEMRESPMAYALLKRSRFALLTNPQNQTERQAKAIAIISFPTLNLKSAKAYRMKLTFQQAYALRGHAGERALRRWCTWAKRCGLAPMKRAATTILKHWDGVISYFRTGLTTAVLEGINSLIQAAKAKARGYRTDRYLIAMIYLLAGKLDFSQTHSK
jgi:transposase